MTRKEKAEVMYRNEDELNKAKYAMARVAEALENAGMTKDAETLMKMVYKLEAFEHKYKY